MDDPRSRKMDAPLESLPDDEDYSELTADLDRYGAHNPGGPFGPSHDNQPRAAAQLGAVCGSDTGEASENKPGILPISRRFSRGAQGKIALDAAQQLTDKDRRLLNSLSPLNRILCRLE